MGRFNYATPQPSARKALLTLLGDAQEIILEHY
jgi:hypothetical protein